MAKDIVENNILDILKNNNFANVKDIAKELNISKMTVRRHLNKLSDENKLLRTHGGALRIDIKEEKAYNIREYDNIDKKILIAKKAAEDIGDNKIIFIDSGTTCYEVSKLIIDKKNLTVITHDIVIASLLFKHHKVYMLGGEISQNYSSSKVDINDKFLNSINIDLLIMGTSSISQEGMLTSLLPERSEIKRLILSKSLNKILVVDSSKFLLNSFIDICSISSFDKIYTDSEIDTELYNNFIAEGVNIIRV